jgi:hypothetical protein
MIKDGKAYGNALVLKHIIKLLENKGVLDREELIIAFDDAHADLRSPKVISPEARADASMAIDLAWSPRD